MDETYLINYVKEDLCFVSTDLKRDFQIAKARLPTNNILREYVLPDYSSIRKGFPRPLRETGTRPLHNEQVIYALFIHYKNSSIDTNKSNFQLLRMNNERFTIPELLFHPTDVGIDQMGISEAIISVIQSFPETLHSHFLRNIILTGGNARMPGILERVRSDVRKESSVYYDVCVHRPEE